MIRLLLLSLILSLTAGVATAPAAEHDHDHDEHEDHGPAQALGEVVVGEVRLALAVAGAVTAGGEAHVEIAAQPATATFTAIRVWIGLETGRGSEKARATAEAAHPGHWSAHVAVPNPLPEGSRLWVQIQPVSGTATLGSLPLPGAAPTPAPPADDDHGHAHP